MHCANQANESPKSTHSAIHVKMHCALAESGFKTFVAGICVREL